MFIKASWMSSLVPHWHPRYQQHIQIWNDNVTVPSRYPAGIQQAFFLLVRHTEVTGSSLKAKTVDDAWQKLWKPASYLHRNLKLIAVVYICCWHWLQDQLQLQVFKLSFMKWRCNKVYVHRVLYSTCVLNHEWLLTVLRDDSSSHREFSLPAWFGCPRVGRSKVLCSY